MEMDCSLSADYLFGPQVSPCRRSFDFTVLFEESILGILPSGIFLVLACFRVWTLIHHKRKTHVSCFYAYKLVSSK
jgi:ATP-binding cassette subfamily C (CFTR/MRP) protein 1